MGRDTLKLLLLGGAIVFAILYGMELSSSGIRQVYGPLDPSDTLQTRVEDSEDWTLPPRKTYRQTLGTAGDGIAIPRHDHKPMVDRVSGAAAETLHQLSSGGVRLVVSLFDRLTGS